MPASQFSFAVALFLLNLKCFPFVFSVQKKQQTKLLFMSNTHFNVPKPLLRVERIFKRTADSGSASNNKSFLNEKKNWTNECFHRDKSPENILLKNVVMMVSGLYLKWNPFSGSLVISVTFVMMANNDKQKPSRLLWGNCKNESEKKPSMGQKEKWNKWKMATE